MKSFFTLLLCLLGFAATAQQTITLTQDLVLSETLVISEDVTYEGNGFSLICDGCNPAIYVTSGATANFNNVIFPKTYAAWLRVEGGSEANWASRKMTGYIRGGGLRNAPQPATDNEASESKK